MQKIQVGSNACLVKGNERKQCYLLYKKGRYSHLHATALNALKARNIPSCGYMGNKQSNFSSSFVVV